MSAPASPGVAPTARPEPAAPRTYQFPRFARRTLPSGMRLVVVPADKLPLATVIALVDAGASVEPAGKEGIAARTLFSGADSARMTIRPQVLRLIAPRARITVN